MPFKPPVTEKCQKCTKSVYAAERMEAGGKVWHKFCFKCSECNMQLNLGSYSQTDGVVYCKKHFQLRFVNQNTQVVGH